MNTESFDPFNFGIPEINSYSIWSKIIAVLLIGIFVTTSLAKIDNSSFDYNEVFIVFAHQDCSGLECILTTCQ